MQVRLLPIEMLRKEQSASVLEQSSSANAVASPAWSPSAVS